MPAEPSDNRTVSARRRLVVATLLCAAATAAAGARWWAQRAALAGEGTVYTDPDRTFYVVDPLLGFAQTDASWFWLGLDALGGLLAATVALLALTWLVRRFGPRAPRLSAVLSSLALVAALGAWVLPVLAWESGMPPADVQASVPRLGAPDGAHDGSFERGTAGRYEVVRDAFSTVVATITAGGETFDVTFEAPEGAITFDPTALGDTAGGQFALDVTTLDSGIALRNEHALEYLAATQHPRITLQLERLDAVQRDESGDEVSFTASATLGFMGEPVALALRGRLVALDEGSERARVGLDPAPDPAAYLLHVETPLDIEKTPLARELEAFDAPTVPLKVRLLLVHRPAVDTSAASAP